MKLLSIVMFVFVYQSAWADETPGELIEKVQNLIQHSWYPDGSDDEEKAAYQETLEVPKRPPVL